MHRIIKEVLFLFLFLYLSNYAITYSAYLLALGDYQELNIEPETYLSIIDVLTFAPSILYLIGAIIYLKTKSIKIQFVIEKKTFF